MNISLATLKPLLKKLVAVKSEIVVLDTKEGVLSAKENNLAVYVTDEVLKDKAGDVFFFPAKKFLSSVNRMSGILTIHLTDTAYSLVSNKTRVELEKSKYPWRFDVPTSYKVVLKTFMVQNMVRYVQIATDPKQQAMTFSGLISLIGTKDFLENSIEALATDGKRVACIREEADVEPFSLMLPSSLVTVLPNLEGENTEFLDTDNYTGLRSGNFVAIANKFTTNFPNVKSLFPSEHNFHILVQAAEFHAALSRIQPMVDEDTKCIELDFGDVVTFRTIGSGGSAKDEINHAGNRMGAYKANFDHKSLSDFFSVAEGIVHIYHTDEKNFIVFENENKRYLMSRMGPGGK